VPADEIFQFGDAAIAIFSLEGSYITARKASRQILNSPLSGALWLEAAQLAARPRRRILRGPITSLASLIQYPPSTAAAARSRLGPGTRGGGKTGLARSGALHCGSREADYIARKSSEAGRQDSRAAQCGVRNSIKCANASTTRLPMPPRSRLFQTPTGASSSREKFQRARRSGSPRRYAGDFSNRSGRCPSGWSITKRKRRTARPIFSAAVPAGAQTPHTPGDWMHPFPPALVNACTHV